MVANLFDQVHTSLQPLANERKIDFVLEVGISSTAQDFINTNWHSLAVSSDETLIRQMVKNLTHNALKFTENGGSVTLRAELLTGKDLTQAWRNAACRFTVNFTTSRRTTTSNFNQPDEMWILIQIEDTSCGVTAEDMTIMFDAYKQLSSGVTKIYQGTGLGLHICHTQVGLLKGVLSVASTKDQGSVFFCAIPVVVSSNIPTTVPPLIAHTAPTEICVDLKNKFFLVVDDSKVNLKLAKQKIQLALTTDARVDFALDGLEAIAIVSKLLQEGAHGELVGVFMDYHMPRCSGLQAILEIRKLETAHGVILPVYISALTADVSSTTTRELLDAGANEVLPKPTPEAALEKVCEKMIHNNNTST